MSETAGETAGDAGGDTAPGVEVDAVFEGGAAKGLCFLGAMRALERRGVRLRRRIGSSAGAMVALLSAAGYDAAGLHRICTTRTPEGRLPFRGFLDVPPVPPPAQWERSQLWEMLCSVDLPLVPSHLEGQIRKLFLGNMLSQPSFRRLYWLLEHGGTSPGTAMVEWLQRRLAARDPRLAEADFSRFHEITGQDITFTATDTGGRRLLLLNHRTAPRCPVVWAARMSMGVPLVWQEVEWRSEWGRYCGQDVTGHPVVDGGMLSNFPIHLLSEPDAALLGEAPPRPFIGFLIDEQLAVPDTPPMPPPRNPRHPLRRIGRILETLLEAHHAAIIEQCAARREVCRLPAAAYSASELDMEDGRLRALIAAADAATDSYLTERFPAPPRAVPVKQVG